MSAEILIALLILLVAGIMAGITGFGLSLMSAPALLLVFDPVTVVVVNAILSLVTGLVIVFEVWSEIRFAAVLQLLPWSVMGLVLGSEVLQTLNPNYIQFAAGIVVLCAALLLARKIDFPAFSGKRGTMVVGVSSGLLATSTGFPSPLAALLFTAKKFTKHNLRASSAAYYSSLGAIGLAILVGRGLTQESHFMLTAAFLPVALFGKVLGSLLLRKLSNESFRKITVIAAMLTGVIGFSTAIEALV